MSSSTPHHINLTWSILKLPLDLCQLYLHSTGLNPPYYNNTQQQPQSQTTTNDTNNINITNAATTTSINLLSNQLPHTFHQTISVPITTQIDKFICYNGHQFQTTLDPIILQSKPLLEIKQPLLKFFHRLIYLMVLSHPKLFLSHLLSNNIQLPFKITHPFYFFPTINFTKLHLINNPYFNTILSLSQLSIALASSSLTKASSQSSTQLNQININYPPFMRNSNRSICAFPLSTGQLSTFEYFKSISQSNNKTILTECIGIVIRVVHLSDKTIYHIDDGSGPLICIIWQTTATLAKFERDLQFQQMRRNNHNNNHNNNNNNHHHQPNTYQLKPNQLDKFLGAVTTACITPLELNHNDINNISNQNQFSTTTRILFPIGTLVRAVGVLDRSFHGQIELKVQMVHPIMLPPEWNQPLTWNQQSTPPPTTTVAAATTTTTMTNHNHTSKSLPNTMKITSYNNQHNNNDGDDDTNIDEKLSQNEQHTISLALQYLKVLKSTSDSLIMTTTTSNNNTTLSNDITNITNNNNINNINNQIQINPQQISNNNIHASKILAQRTIASNKQPLFPQDCSLSKLTNNINWNQSANRNVSIAQQYNLIPPITQRNQSNTLHHTTNNTASTITLNNHQQKSSSLSTLFPQQSSPPPPPPTFLSYLFSPQHFDSPNVDKLVPQLIGLYLIHAFQHTILTHQIKSTLTASDTTIANQSPFHIFSKYLSSPPLLVLANSITIPTTNTSTTSNQNQQQQQRQQHQQQQQRQIPQPQLMLIPPIKFFPQKTTQKSQRFFYCLCSQPDLNTTFISSKYPPNHCFTCARCLNCGYRFMNAPQSIPTTSQQQQPPPPQQQQQQQQPPQQQQPIPDFTSIWTGASIQSLLVPYNIKSTYPIKPLLPTTTTTAPTTTTTTTTSTTTSPQSLSSEFTISFETSASQLTSILFTQLPEPAINFLLLLLSHFNQVLITLLHRHNNNNNQMGDNFDNDNDNDYISQFQLFYQQIFDPHNITNLQPLNRHLHLHQQSSQSIQSQSQSQIPNITKPCFYCQFSLLQPLSDDISITRLPQSLQQLLSKSYEWVKTTFFSVSTTSSFNSTSSSSTTKSTPAISFAPLHTTTSPSTLYSPPRYAFTINTNIIPPPTTLPQSTHNSIQQQQQQQQNIIIQNDWCKTTHPFIPAKIFVEPERKSAKQLYSMVKQPLSGYSSTQLTLDFNLLMNQILFYLSTNYHNALTTLQFDLKYNHHQKAHEYIDLLYDYLEHPSKLFYSYQYPIITKMTSPHNTTTTTTTTMNSTPTTSSLPIDPFLNNDDSNNEHNEIISLQFDCPGIQHCPLPYIPFLDPKLHTTHELLKQYLLEQFQPKERHHTLFGETTINQQFLTNFWYFVTKAILLLYSESQIFIFYNNTTSTYSFCINPIIGQIKSN